MSIVETRPSCRVVAEVTPPTLPVRPIANAVCLSRREAGLDSDCCGGVGGR